MILNSQTAKNVRNSLRELSFTGDMVSAIIKIQIGDGYGSYVVVEVFRGFTITVEKYRCARCEESEFFENIEDFSTCYEI